MSAQANQCAQHCSDERNFADSGEICSFIVILGLVQAQERQDNWTKRIFPVRLTDQVSSNNQKSVVLCLLTSPEGPSER